MFHILLGKHVGDSRRYAGAEVEYRPRREFECRAPGDDSPHTQWPGFQGRHWPPDFTAETGIKGCHVVLLLVFVDDEYVDQTSRNSDHLRVQRPALRKPLDLADDRAARVVDRLCDGQCLQSRTFMLHADIAIFIGRRTANQGDVGDGGLVEQVFTATQVDDLDQVLRGGVVHFAAFLARIDIGMESNVRDHPGLFRRHGAIELANDTLREVVGLDLVADDQLLHELQLQAEIPSDDPLQQALVGQSIQAFTGKGTNPGRMNDGQRTGRLGFEKTFFKLDEDRVGDSHASGAADDDSIAVPDEFRRCLRRDDSIQHYSLSGTSTPPCAAFSLGTSKI